MIADGAEVVGHGGQEERGDGEAETGNVREYDADNNDVFLL